MNIKDVININHGLLTLFYIFRFNMSSISNTEKSYYKKILNPVMTPWLIYLTLSVIPLPLQLPQIVHLSSISQMRSSSQDQISLLL